MFGLDNCSGKGYMGMECNQWLVARFGMLHPGRVAGLLVTNTEHSDSAGLQELMVSS